MEILLVILTIIFAGYAAIRSEKRFDKRLKKLSISEGVLRDLNDRLDLVVKNLEFSNRESLAGDPYQKGSVRVHTPEHRNVSAAVSRFLTAADNDLKLNHYSRKRYQGSLLPKDYSHSDYTIQLPLLSKVLPITEQIEQLVSNLVDQKVQKRRSGHCC